MGLLPAHHFTQVDLLASLAAICLYPLLLVAPGYAIGWLTQVFEFRDRSREFRLALSIPLSISTAPILIYLIGRLVCMRAAVAVLSVVALLGAFLIVRRGLRWPRLPTAAYLIVAAWLAIAVLTSIDLAIGARDYYPVTAFDYAVRSEFIHSIATTGIPPGNPFFFPGHAVELRYHYFWLLLPGLVYQAAGHTIDPRAAWIGSVFWSGLGFMCLVAVALRVFWPRPGFPRRAVAGLLLLGVTGLDIIPTAFLWLLRATGILRAVLPSMEWWNEQVDGFVYTALWEAHHLAGLTACLMAFLLIQEGARQGITHSRARSLPYAAVAGLALASAVGASIHIAFVFAIYLLVWTPIVVLKRWWRHTAVLSVAGTVAVAAALPYLLSLRGPAGQPAAAAAGGLPIELWVRPFSPVNSIVTSLHAAPAVVVLANLIALPLNYLLELGFFFAAALIWWRKRSKAQSGALSAPELSLAVMVAVSIVVCTFMRSSVIGNNDLGWRGFLLAQFGLLLWSVDVLCDSTRRRLLTVLLALGALGTLYDIAILRLYPVLADTGLVAKIGWMAPDRQLGARNYAAREAYEWIARSTPPRAVIQFDPHVDYQDTSALLYSRRQIAAADLGCLAVFGGDKSLCPALVASLAQLYPAKDEPAAANKELPCQSLPIDILVAKDTDPAWADPHGWVWMDKPVFANRYFRVFRCRDGGTQMAGAGNAAQ